MGHQVYAGQFSALEARLLETIQGLQGTDPLAPVSILVGSNILAAHLRGRIAEKGRGVANVRFYTFLDLVAKLGEDPGGAPAKPRLSGLAPSRILEDTLARYTPAVFGAVERFAGFRSALLDTFRDLRDAGVDSALLDESIPALVQHLPERAGHLRAIGDLYRRYRERVADFQDVDDDFRVAIARASYAPVALQTPVLLIYGFYDVTGQQGELLRALREPLSLTYFVPFSEESSSGFAKTFLESISSELRAPIDHLIPELRSDSLSRLAARLFAPLGFAAQPGGAMSGPLPANGSFALVSVPGDSRAAIEIVREVLQAVRDGIISGFHEAAVILRHPEDDLPLVTEALRTRNIPYYLHGGTSFTRRPLARAILALCLLESESFSRQSILTAMELIAAALPPDQAVAWQVSEWRVLTNEYRFLAGAEAWDVGTRALVEEMQAELHLMQSGLSRNEEGDEDIKSAEVLRRKLNSGRWLRSGWEALWRAVGDWPSVFAWNQWAELLEERLEPLLGHSADWEAFTTALDELSNLSQLADGSPAQPVPRERLINALTESLKALSCPEGRFQQRGVNLLSTAAARGLRFPLVIVPGLDEGKFPARLRQDPLLLDAERAHIGKPSRLSRKSLRGEEEKLLFDMAVRSAEKRLVLITSRLEESADRERIPSGFFLRAATAARGATVSLRELTPDLIPGFRSVSLENPAPAPGLLAVDAGEIRLRLIAESRLPAADVLALIAAEEPRLLKGPLAYDKARWSKELTEYDGRFRRPDLVSWLRQTLGPAAGQVSASRIEEYAKCPYLFYLKRAVGLERVEEVEPAVALDPLERGQALHEILERFLCTITAERFAHWSGDRLWTLLEPLARARLAKMRPSGIPDLLWEIELDRLLRLLRNWLAFEKDGRTADLLPAQFERPFGRMRSGEDSPPFVVRAGRHAFMFRGRVDRIDLSADGSQARVIDYKIGRLPRTMNRNEISLLMGGEKIQLAVYRGALTVLPDLGSPESVGGEYLHLQAKDGQVLACSFTDGELRDAGDRLVQMLEIIGDLLEDGIFFARSQGSVYPDGHCQYCDYLTICGKDRVQREERKASDPAVRRFATLQRVDEALADQT